MSNVPKGKSKKSMGGPGQNADPDTQVEEMSVPSRLKKKEGLQNVSPIPPSLSRATSGGPSERGQIQGYQPVSNTSANANISNPHRSVKIKNDLGKSLKPADRRMGNVDRASEEATVDKKDQLIARPLVRHAEKITSKRQVQFVRTIGGGASHAKKLDKGKGRDNQAEGVGGTSRLAPISGHLHRDYDNHVTPTADDRKISCIQSPDSGVPSGTETAHLSTQGSASHLHGAHHFTIGGNPRFENNRVKLEYYYGNQPGTYYDIPILKEFVSFNAMHDSAVQDPTRRVHPGTRQRVLTRIRDWIDTPSAKERIFWLHGPAGVGKSAIAQTIARSCAKGKLAATFFFYRSDPSCNNGNRLFTTLAWQFAYSIPATKSTLIRSLIERPDICTKDVETQFEELIVKPFLELKRSGVQLSALVVIIDGVDECSDDNLQRRFLKIIGNTVKDDNVPLRFLICSRPEAHIQDTIDAFRSITLPLDLAKLDDANKDIEKYLRAEFSRIATEQDLDSVWPGEQVIQEFVYKASGQFIYATTVIKYVGDEYNSAETQLDIIRGLKPTSNISPFAELDELYKEILRRQRDPVFLKDFLSLFIGRNATGSDLYKDDAMLMDVSEKGLHRKLRGMRSLLKFELYIDVHHRSFLDFLQDSSRSGQYHISQQAGIRGYLNFIVGSLVRYASTVIEGHVDHKTHFCPRFYEITDQYFTPIVLPVEEWQQALQPLVDLQNKLLTLPNFCSAWEFLPCKKCTGFSAMRNLLLHLAFLRGASDHIVNSHTDGSEEIRGSVMTLIATETDMENNLSASLSSLLHQLRGRESGVPLGTEMIQLLCSLLRFDHTEITIKLRSIMDAQNLIDAIDELINTNSNCILDISCKVVRLALEIYTRVPVLPRSLFSKGTVGPHYDVWRSSNPLTRPVEVLWQTAFMSKILDPSYIMRVLRVYHEDYELLFVAGKVNENKESLKQWRTRLKLSAVTRMQVMLAVAKALRYFHSLGILVQYYVDSDDIFVDSEFHAKFLFFGLTARYVNATTDWYIDQHLVSYERDVSFFGCLFYEMCVGDRIIFHDIVSSRPSKQKIRDDEWQLIQRCCAKDPKTRPTMDDVVREMEAWEIS